MAPTIQVALDMLDADLALKVADQVASYVDILEAGTPLIKSVGIGIVTKLKKAHPDKLVLADLKSSDVGAYEADMAFKAGADIVTTQGITTMATIDSVQKEADKWKRRAEVDMTGVADVPAKAKILQTMNVSLVLFHRSIDEETTRGALWDEKACKTVEELCNMGLDVAIAGGVNNDILPKLKNAKLYGIVVGRGITAQEDPGQAAKSISEKVKEIWG
jgi:3-hexulose-6-phosphate synthase